MELGGGPTGLGGRSMASCGGLIGMDGGLIALVGFPRHRVGVPALGLTGGMGVPAVTVQEPVAEAAAAAEVSRGTAGFPGATEPW